MAATVAVAASAQAPAPVAGLPVVARAPSSMAPAPPAAVVQSPAVSVVTTPRPQPLAPLPGASAVRAANAAARSYPHADSYLNATLFYDYEVGRLYQVQTSPRFLTAIMLRPGEKLLAKAAGDTVRWVLGETAQGIGPNQQAVVLIKPMRGGLRTNIVLTTDQRTYLIEAASREGTTYTSAVSWTYPVEEMQALAAAQAAASAVEAQKATVVVAPALAIDQLHFGYQVQPLKGKAPRWQPLRVFDDGAKTYIQFPVNMASTDAPPLFLVGPGASAELVNYRYVNGYYVVDRLIDVAELRLGETPQTVVRITRTGDRG
ncbi:MAG: P-type conjugative transfer protein TrbG [Caulobacterales bacterium 68-7]|nr:MAG: P-type conjugative transfer protein TrbG [Caulobacterales bacterium 68-7]